MAQSWYRAVMQIRRTRPHTSQTVGHIALFVRCRARDENVIDRQGGRLDDFAFCVGHRVTFRNCRTEIAAKQREAIFVQYTRTIEIRTHALIQGGITRFMAGTAILAENHRPFGRTGGIHRERIGWCG